MRLILFRHAIAEEREDWAEQSSDDSARPLTERGIMRLHQGCAGLRHVVSSIDFIFASPLVRARQTAEILSGYFERAELEITPELSPGAAHFALVQQLAVERPEDTVCLVGHEPDFSELAAELLFGERFSFLRVKKASAIGIEVSLRGSELQALMVYQLPPAVLRRLGASM